MATSNGGGRLAERTLAKSRKIKDGTPAVFRFEMETAMKLPDKMLCKKVSGTPKPGQTEKVLMVLGATGAGKTTLINGMINYIMGVQWDDSFRYELISEIGAGSEAHSRTREITAYTLHKMEGARVPYTFTIIDTPGFGDTAGMQRDKFISDQVKDFFSLKYPEGIDHIDGIGFVVPSPSARLTPSQKYIFDCILKIFGNDVKNNIFTMVTFADGKKPPVLAAIEEAKIPCEKFFKFNNSALYSDNADNADNEDDFDEMFWKMGEKSFKRFFQAFEEANSVSLQLTRSTLEERSRLQTLVAGLQPRVQMGFSKLEEIRQEEVILNQRMAEIEANRSFTYEMEEIRFRQNALPQGRHTTTCMKCNFTCHEVCQIAANEDKARCWAMDGDGNCRMCQFKCSWHSHKNLPYVIENYTVTVTKTSDELKRKYDKAVAGKSLKERMIDSLELHLQATHREVLGLVRKIRESLRRLDEIALKPNPLTELEYIDLQIESEKSEKKPGWSQRLQYYQAAKEQLELLATAKNPAEFQRLSEKLTRGTRSVTSFWKRFRFW